MSTILTVIVFNGLMSTAAYTVEYSSPERCKQAYSMLAMANTFENVNFLATCTTK